MSHESRQTGIDHEHLPAEVGRKLQISALSALGASALLSVLGLSADHRRFEHAYLAAFAFVVTIGLGALFFVLLQHLVRAGWSVSARRHMEWLASVLPWCALLFLPVVFFAPDLYPWMGAEAVVSEVVHKKVAYLNPTFFYLRSAFYFAVWSLLAVWFSRQSAAQDLRNDPSHTARMQTWSAPAMLLFGLTTTFAGFDWLMSLQPEWYSTIFGVYVFAGAVTSSLSLLALLTIALQKARFLQRVSNVEHLHDIGKLIFGFVIFWAYIAFSQYCLIWYANIPEETSFYEARWEHGWATTSLILVALHFVVPFVMLLSRAAKRTHLALGMAAAILVFAHAVDVYWLVMPALDSGQDAQFRAIDLAAFSFPLASLFAVVAWRMAKGPLFPIHDPRLPEALELTNV